MKFYMRIVYFSILVLLPFLKNHLKAQNFKRTSLDINVKVNLPENFLIMSDDDIARKYPSYRKPLAMYTSLDRMADFGYNVSNGVWGDDINLLRRFYLTTIKNTFTKVEILKDTILYSKKKPYFHLEYLSEIHDEENSINSPRPPIKNYTYSVYTTELGEIYIFNFNCPSLIYEKWRPIATVIANSITVSKRSKTHDVKIIKKNNTSEKSK